MNFKKDNFYQKQKFVDKYFAALLSIFLVAGLYTTASAQTKKETVNYKYSTSHEAIMQVFENFRMAIIEKDRQKFLSLFYPDSSQISWISVYADSSLKRIHKKIQKLKKSGRKNLPEVTKTSVSTPENFIESLISSPAHFEELFHNLKIITDGNVASVAFDYEAQVNGQLHNHGKEIWHLVRTNNGWKINSIIYSIIIDESALKRYLSI
jgi:hypothetical protein